MHDEMCDRSMEYIFLNILLKMVTNGYLIWRKFPIRKGGNVEKLPGHRDR